MNGTGAAAAGGVGKYLTEWIVNGESSVNLWMFDVRRFVDLHNNKKFLRDRVTETFGQSQCLLVHTEYICGCFLTVLVML